MSKRRAIRLIAPITVGPALVGSALLYRCSGDEERLLWDEENPPSLTGVARSLPEEPTRPGFSPPKLNERPTAPAARSKVHAQSTTSDHALVGKMVPPPTLKDPVFQLPEPAFGLEPDAEPSHLAPNEFPDAHRPSGSLTRAEPAVRMASAAGVEREPADLAFLAEDTGPIAIAPEIELPYPSFGMGPDAEAVLAGAGAAETAPAEVARTESVQEPGPVSAVADALPTVPVASVVPEVPVEPVASVSTIDDLPMPEPGDDPQDEERSAFAFVEAGAPLVSTAADAPTQSGSERVESLTNLAAGEPLQPTIKPPPGADPAPAEKSSPLAHLTTTSAPNDVYKSIVPFSSRSAPDRPAEAAENPPMELSPAATLAEALPSEIGGRPGKEAQGASQAPDYSKIAQSEKTPLSLKSLLPAESSTTRTRLFPAAKRAEKPYDSIAQPDGETNPAMMQGTTALATTGSQSVSARFTTPRFTYDDELILQIQVVGIKVSDTIIAYGNRDGLYLPLGELGRILDLAIRISDDGNYASGWFLSEDRTLYIDLRNETITTVAGTRPLPLGYAVAFEGEMFLRIEGFADLLPLGVKADLRAQRVVLTTLEIFPFEERMKRDSARAQLNARNALPAERRWPREETPYLGFSIPMADFELRGVSDTARGTRLEGDLRLAGDLAWMTAQSFIGVTTRDGLVTGLLELGRRDPDAELLGPLQATEFQLGDVSTTSMSLGLRGVAGRGAYISNQPFDSISLFDRIDLRGVLQDGFEVELYRNNILLGSTRKAVNGQYEFLQVPVDYGLNVFRLVFYGPQGQRREELRRISVGDGRLAQGQLTYTLGAVQRNVNLLGVTGPDFRPGDRYGDWQGVAELAYGLNPVLTAVANAAIFEDNGEGRWLAGLGLRTGISGFAIRADAGISEGGGLAAGLGLGGRALGGAFTLSHFEYGGGFVDETRAFTSQPLVRATELDFNTSVNLGGVSSGSYLPITLRGRHLEFASGQKQTNAALRSSRRFPGVLASSTLEYSRNSSPNGSTVTQLSGNFDLASFNQSDVQFRGSLGYRIAPDPEITTVSAEANYAVDDRTAVRGSASYSFAGDDLSFGLSAIREFERFTLALDGRYRVEADDYAVVLRLGFSLGYDPKRKRTFLHRPGLASSGAISARVFQDRDGNGMFGPGDEAMPAVTLSVYNNTATTNSDGYAMLGELGSANRVSVRLDPSTLPDIVMAPVNPAIEIVPRPGRIHTTDFPVVELSEIEGTVAFGDDSNGRGVSGLRLQLRSPGGEEEHFVRTERGGYFFFENVKPGRYEIIIDPGQAQRLDICLGSTERIFVQPTGDIISKDLKVGPCETEAKQVSRRRPSVPSDTNRWLP